MRDAWQNQHRRSSSYKSFDATSSNHVTAPRPSIVHPPRSNTFTFSAQGMAVWNTMFHLYTTTMGSISHVLTHAQARICGFRPNRVSLFTIEHH